MMPLRLVVDVEMKEDFGGGDFFVEVKKKEKGNVMESLYMICDL